MSSDIVRRIQSALDDKGFEPGPIDGLIFCNPDVSYPGEMAGYGRKRCGCTPDFGGPENNLIIIF